MRGIGAGHMDALRTPIGTSLGAMWETRDPENKRQVVVSEIAERLRGLSTLMYGMALRDMKGGNPNTAETSFLAASVGDLALALERVHADYWQQMAEQELAAEATERNAAKRKKRGGVA
jgi:hypothetical protein